MPLGELLREYVHADPRGGNGRTLQQKFEIATQLASELGLLPNAHFLRDGLRRTLRSLSGYGKQLDSCLRAAPVPVLNSQSLTDEAEALLAWIEGQAWSPDDPRLRLMGREAGQEAHPLSGYALSVCHHWSNLFYTLDPTAGPNNVDEGARAYEDFMGEFSMYVLAAQATIEPNGYFQYCSEWWRTRIQPARNLYPKSRLASRVADASRAVRRLSLPEYHDLFAALSRTKRRWSFAERAFAAARHAWPAAAQHDVKAICRLLEDVVPGWSTHRRKTQHPGSDAHDRAPGKTVRRQYPDGYVRISESPCISTTTIDESGVQFETTLPRPLGLDDVLSELADSVDAKVVENSGFIFPTHDLKADLRAFAEAQLDGQQWIPTEERVSGGGIECVMVNDATGFHATPGVHPGMSSRWAADQRRRMLMAHRLVPDHLQRVDIFRLLDAMHDDPVPPEDAPALACLHAAIALGRPLDQATSLHIHESLQDTLAPDQIHYALKDHQWVVYAPPPAWKDLAVTRCERPLGMEIRLHDRTRFFEVLERLHLNHPGCPVQRLSTVRLDAIRRWIRRVLPAADATLEACTSSLFEQLLEVSGGDLGLAHLITGHRLAHSNSVAHYAHYGPGVLWDAYRKCWAPEPTNTGKRTVLGLGVPIPESDAHCGFGARRVPTISSVRSLLSWLRERIKQTADADRHNYYTAYTWAGLVLGTGLRPVIDPYLYPVGTGVTAQPVVTFLDKARSDYHRRINVIPAAVAQHLDRYAHHLRDLDRNAAAPIPPQVTAFRYCAPDTGAYRAFRPRDFETLCKSEFDLELYALRRFVRTELVSDPDITCDAKLRADLQITPEDVDVFMGHWFDGVSPHDPFSTYPTLRLQAVAHAVSALLRKVAFKPFWIDQWRT